MGQKYFDSRWGLEARIVNNLLALDGGIESAGQHLFELDGGFEGV